MLSFQTLLLMPSGSQTLAPVPNTTARQTKSLVDAPGGKRCCYLRVRQSRRGSCSRIFPPSHLLQVLARVKVCGTLSVRLTCNKSHYYCPRLVLWTIISYVWKNAVRGVLCLCWNTRAGHSHRFHVLHNLTCWREPCPKGPGKSLTRTGETLLLLNQRQGFRTSLRSALLSFSTDEPAQGHFLISADEFSPAFQSR